MKNNSNKFDWAEKIVISAQAPSKYHPDEFGYVCGMIGIDTPEAEIAYDCVGSRWLYTIELMDGDSLEIPEIYLKKLQI